MDIETRAPLAVLADAHFSPDTPQRLDAFLSLLGRFPADFASLVLLGDLFDFWVGIKGRFPVHQAKVIDGVRAARRRGAAVYYVEGNRDFGIARIDGGTLFDRVFSRQCDVTVAGRRLRLTHGDLINRRDWRYRTWRRASRHVLAPLALRVLPPVPLLGLASRVERALRGTNAAGRRGFPRELCLAWAAQSFSRGFDAVIVGHFHHKETIALEHEGSPRFFFSVPSWTEAGTLLVADRDGTLTFS